MKRINQPNYKFLSIRNIFLMSAMGIVNSDIASAATCSPTSSACIQINTLTTLRTIPKTLYGTNLEWVDDANLTADQTTIGKFLAGPQTAAQTIGVSSIRFPGGVYSDYYVWKNGVTGNSAMGYATASDRQNKNIPDRQDSGSYKNRIGTDDVVKISNTIGGQSPVYSVNIFSAKDPGSGTIYKSVTNYAFKNQTTNQSGINYLLSLASDWITYANSNNSNLDPVKERIANGYTAPFNVTYWEIGNENYWRGYSYLGEVHKIDTGNYVSILQQFSSALKNVDNAASILALGVSNVDQLDPAYKSYTNPTDECSDPDNPSAPNPLCDNRSEIWNKTLRDAYISNGKLFDMMAFHRAYAPNLTSNDTAGIYDIYQAMWAYPLVEAEYYEVFEKRWLKAGNAKAIPIAITEWGPLFNNYTINNSNYYDHSKTLGSALFAASTLEMFIRNPNIQVANYFKFTDRYMLGSIGNSQLATDSAGISLANKEKATGYVFELFNKYFGSTLVQTTPTLSAANTYNSVAIGNDLKAWQNVPKLDVVSSLSVDGKKLYIVVVNKTLNTTAKITGNIVLNDFVPSAQATAYVLKDTRSQLDSRYTLVKPCVDANDGADITDTDKNNLGLATQARDSNCTATSSFDGKVGDVGIVANTINNASANFSYDFEPMSVTSIVLTKAP